MNLKPIQEAFSQCKDRDSLYKLIMEWGKKLPPLDPSLKTEENLVPGCQSLMYLTAKYEEGKLHFAADSDALISKGLAAIIIFAYQGEAPQTVITTPPTFLKELGILESLTPGRANGAVSLYLKMREEAVKIVRKTAP